VEFAADHELLKSATREAGALALSYFRAKPEQWTKGRGDPVSEADIAVDELLKEKLLGARPTYGWLSEETEDNAKRLGENLLWIVDPIDGTRAFLEERPEFTVATSLVAGNRPVCGCVYNPATDEFFEAIAGGGARLNGATIHVSDRDGFDGARLLASARMVKSTIEEMDVKPAAYDAVNSVAYRMALVACGHYDATLSLGPKSDWDLAAADLIVAEAGGLSGDRFGAPFRYNEASARQASLISANPALHAALVEVVTRIEWGL
jgi:myo-inositol-1(or 4)-monophosphatase